MKNKSQFHLIPLFVLSAGVLGLLMRFWLVGDLDSKGLLPAGHLAGTLLWILSLAMLVLILLMTRGLKKAADYESNFPASRLSALTTALAGIAIGYNSVLTLLTEAPVTMDLFCGILGILSALALMVIAYFRLSGARPNPMLHALISVYFTIKLLNLYRSSSGDPQLLDYIFSLLAVVCLMLTCYQRATFAANFGSRRSHAFFSLSAAYCCCVSLRTWADALYFLPLALWMATDVCCLLPGTRWQTQGADQ